MRVGYIVQNLHVRLATSVLKAFVIKRKEGGLPALTTRSLCLTPLFQVGRQQVVPLGGRRDPEQASLAKQEQLLAGHERAFFSSGE